MKDFFEALLFSVLLLSSTSEAATIKRCNLQFKCSLEENSVSASDGKRCFVFRNGCFLAKENCDRKNKCQPELKVITRKQCKLLCIKFCPKFYKPFCCVNKKTRRTFSNECDLNRYICESGKTCSSILTGQCYGEL